jgi:hypothetical protein
MNCWAIRKFVAIDALLSRSIIRLGVVFAFVYDPLYSFVYSFVVFPAGKLMSKDKVEPRL